MPSTFPEGVDPISYAEDGVYAGKRLTLGGALLTAAGIAIESGIAINTGLAIGATGLVMWLPSRRTLRRHDQMVSDGFSQLEGFTDASS